MAQAEQGNCRLHFACAAYSQHHLSTDRWCGLLSTCWRRTEPRT